MFGAVAVAEAVTWALLLAGMLGAYVLDLGRLGIRLGGGVHGFVFLLYVVVAVVVAMNQRWRAGVTALALAAAVVPFATIPLEIAYARRGLLDGGWRTEATADPRDARPLDRVVRWWVARPVLFAGVGVVAVAALFAVLLVVGPPDGSVAS